MCRLRDKSEILVVLKGEYEKAELSLVDVFSQTMTKEDLKDLIRFGEYKVKLSLNKPEMSEEVSLAIEKEYLKFLQVISSTELMEIEKLILNNMSIVDLDKNIEFLRLRNRYSLKGFVYFLESEEHFPSKILVVPKEIIDITVQNIDKLDYDLLEKRDEIIKIITGLTNLYGVYKMSHLKFMLDNLGVKDIDDNLLEECIAGSSMTKNIFSFNNDYIVHEACMTDMSFNYIVNNSKSNEYYIPSYDEVINYVDDEMNTKRKGFIDISDFLRRLAKNSYFNADELALKIYDLCIMDAPVDDILEEFNSSNIVFDNDKQVKEMLSIVMNLNNDTRKWINKGFTQNEMSKKNSDDIINVNKEMKKVGRNDSCPCGSGKKYKKCCMGNNQ